MNKIGANVFLTGGALKDPELSAPAPTVETALSTAPGMRAFGADGNYTEGVALLSSAFAIGEAYGKAEGGAILSGMIVNAATADYAEGNIKLAPVRQYVGTAGEPVPDITYGTSIAPIIKAGESRSYTWTIGLGETTGPGMSAFGADAPFVEGFAEIKVDVTGFSQSLVQMLWVRMPKLFGAAAEGLVVIEEGVDVSAQFASVLGNVLSETLRVQESLGSVGLSLNSSVTESAAVKAAMSAPYFLSLLEEANIDADEAALTYRFVELAASIAVDSETNSQASLVVGLAAAMTVRSVLGASTSITLAEAISVASENDALLRQFSQLAEQVIVALNSDAMVAITVGIEDDIEIAADISSIAQLGVLLSEGADVYLTIKDGDTVIQGWVVNTKSAAFSEYRQYPFNSMVEVSGRYFAVAEDGLYEITGDTDEGQNIEASIKTGLLDMGSHFIKDVKSAYIGHTADGELVLKVTTTMKGKKEQWWYKMEQVQGGSLRDGRVTIGRGLRAKYWQFELANVDGADFDLDGIDFKYNILSRRVR